MMSFINNIAIIWFILLWLMDINKEAILLVLILFVISKLERIRIEKELVNYVC